MQSCSQCSKLPLNAKLLTLHTNFFLINAEYNKVVHFFAPILTCTNLRRLWPAPILACADFGLRRFWPAPILACADFGLRRFWPAPILACTDYAAPKCPASILLRRNVRNYGETKQENQEKQQRYLKIAEKRLK